MVRARFGFVISLPLLLVACATAQDDTGLTDGAGSPGAGLPGGLSGSPSGVSGSGSGVAGSVSSAGRAGSVGAGGSSAAGSSSGGKGGTAGSSGGSTGGKGGAAGPSGGSGPVFEAGECAVTPTMSLQYQQTSNNVKQIGATFTFVNTSDTPIAVGDLKIRYFFSNEEASGWKAMVYSAQVDGGTGGYRPLTAGTTVKPLGMSLSGADTYTEVAFTAGVTLEKGATAKVSWDMQPNDYNAPDQVQTNDYSYDATATALKTWDHVAIYSGATLVWGCTPGDGMGAAGTSG